MQKASYYEGWGYSDTVKVLIKGKEADRNLFYKELKSTFPTEDIRKSGTETIEVFVYEKQIPTIKKMATVFKMKIAYKEGGKLDQIETAKIILDQLGGQRKLVMFTGAYNFVAIKNGVTFRIKNRGVNFIQIVLNGKDLYDVTFSKFFKLSLKKVSEHNDVYFDELIPLFEKNTGMYLKFENGGNIALPLNRKTSNLSIEQSKIVRAPEFKKWFGDWETESFKRNHKAISEISTFNTISLDENGEPKIWYRASYSDYSEIKQKNIYLGAKQSYVKQYGNDVKMFFVKSNKTIFIDNEDIERKHLGIGFEYLSEYINQENKIPLKGANYNKLKQIFSKQSESEYLAVWEYFTELENLEVLNLFKSWFKENGFDSIQYWETGKKNNFGKYPIGLITLYFGDASIKLANGKNITFDSNTPNIAFAEGGMPQGLSIADANPYIAGAKAVQGIAPSSVSALDQRIASRINPDPNRPVFFKTGGNVEKKFLMDISGRDDNEEITYRKMIGKITLLEVKKIVSLITDFLKKDIKIIPKTPNNTQDYFVFHKTQKIGYVDYVTGLSINFKFINISKLQNINSINDYL